jgi:HNH endonuclease
MREPKTADLVFHFLHDTWPNGISDSRLSGTSTVSKECVIVRDEPPMAGGWSNMVEYYRIELEGYAPTENPVPSSVFLNQYGDEIRKEIIETRPFFFPFNTYGDRIRLVQGIYLAKCTSNLYRIITKALKLQGEMINDPLIDPHAEYAEVLRLAGERLFFSRNSKLRSDATALYGARCQACGLNFSEFYGPLGDGYIECHHVDPLSERSELEWTEGLKTRIDGVNVLCANCHRMIHRRKPAITLRELRLAIESTTEAIGDE